MQNQPTTGQSNLQQTTSNLQPNQSNLQQGGTPAGSSDVFTVLSQDAQASGLRVQSAQTDPASAPQTYMPATPVASWLVPFAFIAAIVIALALYVRLRNSFPEAVVIEEEPKPAKAVASAPKKKKPAKKTTRRKRSSKR